MTHPYIATLSERFGGILAAGKHAPDGVACALEVATVAHGKPWSDAPAIAGLPDLRPLNDGPWSSDQARTEALAPVVVALWEWPTWKAPRRKAFAQSVAERTIREVLPVSLRAIGLEAEANRCEDEGTESAARAAAESAARAAAESAESAAESAESAEAAARAAWSAESAESAAWSAWSALSAARSARAAAESAAESAARSAESAARSAGSAARAAAESAARAAAESAARSAPSADKLLIRACSIWREAAESTAP